jgi:hypothetical protein
MLRPTSCALSHVINLNKETESNEDTEPRHCRNILLAVVPLVHSLFSTLLSNVVSWFSSFIMSLVFFFQSPSSRRICRVTMSAVGATVPNLSGCFAHSFKYWCVGAALLAKALDCGREGWAFGKCAACGGFTVGLHGITVTCFRSVPL